MAELSDNDFALWERYRALGTPEHVEAALVERDDLARRATIREAAAIAGFKESALARLAGDLPIAVRDGAAFVATDGEETPLADYAAREWAEFLPSLKATEEAPRTPYIRQTSAQGGAPPPSPAQAYISRTYLRPVQGKASS